MGLYPCPWQAPRGDDIPVEARDWRDWHGVTLRSNANYSEIAVRCNLPIQEINGWLSPERLALNGWSASSPRAGRPTATVWMWSYPDSASSELRRYYGAYREKYTIVRSVQLGAVTRAVRLAVSVSLGFSSNELWLNATLLQDPQGAGELVLGLSRDTVLKSKVGSGYRICEDPVKIDSKGRNRQGIPLKSILWVRASSQPAKSMPNEDMATMLSRMVKTRMLPRDARQCLLLAFAGGECYEVPAYDSVASR